MALPRLAPGTIATALRLALLTSVLTARVIGVQPDPQPGVGPTPKYAEAAGVIDNFVVHEMADKRIPGLSIALVDDQQIVWAKGFGLSDLAKHVPATAETVHRAGSVSKLFTDIGVMQLVEQGKLDLDAPIQNYLPSFKPRNPFGGAITLRQLMSHRSGLVREPPVGNYFDPTSPSLARTVASLNRTELVYAPGTRTKYSNAGIAVVGYVLERKMGMPFARYLKGAVLEPMGLTHSSFTAEASIIEGLAKGQMWTLDGRTNQAPRFALGISPAGSLYTSVMDLGRFLSVLFAGGKGPKGVVVQPSTLEKMWTPQFAEPGQKSGYGIGFRLYEVAGHRAVGHDGAVYGFATSLRALPDDKLGVVVIATKDIVNAVTDRIADAAVTAMVATRGGTPVQRPEQTAPVPRELARDKAGRYEGVGGTTLDLVDDNGELLMLASTGGVQSRLRAVGEAIVTDGAVEYGTPVRFEGDRVVVGTNSWKRAAWRKPASAPAFMEGLIGEYGWDHDILYIFERDGQLWALIEWFEFDPLERVSDNVFKFPSSGLYRDERLIFKRDARGVGTEVNAANVAFKRRAVGPGEGARQLTVKPLRPVADLLREAQRARPPKETGDFREPDLVELVTLDPSIKLEVRYASTNNFLGSVFYPQARSFMQRPAAEALVRAHHKLQEQGYGLLIHDAYRPWFVTKVFWDATPADKRWMVANPAEGSKHNRGAAVDLTLYDLGTGEPVPMVSTYDESTGRAYANYPGGTSLQRWHRALLRRAMESEGFSLEPEEWWHFNYRDWSKYPIGNAPFWTETKN